MTPAPGMPLAELQATLAALQGQSPQFDPPRLRGVESLLERAQQQRPSVQAPLLRRAASMLADYRRDCEQFSEQPSRLAGVLATHRQQLATRRSGAASALRALQAELNRDTPDDAASDEASSPISALLRQQEFSLLGASQSHAPDNATSEPPKELRALRQLRSRQRHQDIEQRIDQAIQNAPQDPGPLNPQMLAIRSLTNMRERSPAYLKQFVGYLDTLLWLEAQLPGEETSKAGKGKRRKAR
ncbi:DUF2894 domain-containing protein [Spongiibacter marinus]|uniref:DUF2894 domain-containing protein n=1 Tax=Spongiibacter marinus TaxID=354246 RepID=UPI000421F0F1|nr:DUF2894 domain-containing protein [Spongiibacter marinus]